MAYLADTESAFARQAMVGKAMNTALLEREEEKTLASAWKDKRDEKALHRLISAHMRLVVSLASKFRHYGLPVSDLIQEGNIGLLYAADRFEPERDIRFSTYAGWWIRSCIQDFVLRNWSIVRTGTTSSQKALFFNLRRLRAKIEEKTGGALTHEGRQKIAAALNTSVRDVEEMERRMGASDQSLNATVGEGGEDSWQDFLVDERPTPEDIAIDEDSRRYELKLLDQAMGTLSDRERIIIGHRRLNDNPLTLEELGTKLGVSKERVRQIENRALEKLTVNILSHCGGYRVAQAA
jgi:RNA polymerase sigma-32 factor